MAEKVGALAYDVVMNTVRLEKGAAKTRSTIKTLTQNFKKAVHPVQEYEQRMRDLLLALGSGQITADQFTLFRQQELDSLEKAGFLIDKNGTVEKTRLKILQETHAQLKENNAERRVEKQIQEEMARSEKASFVKRRNRGAEEHQKVMDRLHARKKLNKSIHHQAFMDFKHNAKRSANLLKSMSSGQKAGVLGNLAGALGFGGASIGAVRGAAMLGGKVAVFVGSVAALGLALAKATKNAAEFRKTTIDLSVLMGNNTQAAESLIKRFQLLARETPLTTMQLAEGARQLMSFGRASSLIVSDLKNIGTIAGGDAERMRLLVKAFGDVTAAGKLQGQELRQFTNQGWNPLRKMVEMTGESYDDLRAKMEDGMITADMVSRAMSASAADYGDRLEKAMDTMGAQWTKLKGLLTEVSIGPGSPIERAGAFMLGVTNAILVGWTEEVPAKLNKAGTAIGNSVGRINEHIQRLNNIMDNPIDFLRGDLQEPNRFGDILTAEQLAENLKKGTEGVLESQRMAREMEGKTTQQNQKLLDETRKQISEQKKVVQDLDDQFNRISKFTRMRLDAKLERKRKDLHEKDYQLQLKNIQILEDMHEEEEKKRRMVEAPGQDLEKMHAHRLKMIEEEGDARRKSIEDAYQLEMKQANLLRSMGGPSEDFTAAGADYKFIAKRQAEIEAIRFEKQATKKREDQLLILHNDLEGLRTDAKLERETLKNVLGVVP